MDHYDSVIYGQFQDIIASIRQVINSPIRGDATRLEKIQNIAMELEGLRFALSQIRRNERYNQSDILKDLLKSRTSRLIENEDFKELLSQRPFRYRSILSRERPAPEELDGNNGRVVNINDALLYLIQLSDRLVQPSLFEEVDKQPADVATLRRIIPNQKISPVHFEIYDGRLKIAHQPASISPPNSAYARSARELLIERGEELLSQLRQSNCDRRLLDTVASLQEKLVTCDDIIQLGIMNMGVDLAGKQFSEELPPIITAMLQTQTSGIGLYVSQFPDWQKFTEAAALTELHEGDIVRIADAAIDIVEELERSPELIDQDVPKTIRMLHLLITDPQKATKRAAFAVVRTIENLVAKVFGYGLSFIDETITKTSQKASSFASNAVIYGLLCLALQSATGMTAAAPQLADTAWMRSAAQIIQRQIHTISKSIAD